MGRLASLQRRNEVEVMQFCFEKLGLNVVGQVEEPGRLEGGDFFAAGEPSPRLLLSCLRAAPTVSSCQQTTSSPSRSSPRCRVAPESRQRPLTVTAALSGSEEGGQGNSSSCSWRLVWKPLCSVRSVSGLGAVGTAQGRSCACWAWGYAPTWRRRSS
jgi:hypothetical protein